MKVGGSLFRGLPGIYAKCLLVNC